MARKNCNNAKSCRPYLRFLDSSLYPFDETHQISTTANRACMKINKGDHSITDAPCWSLAYAACEFRCDTIPSPPTQCQNDLNSTIPGDFNFYILGKFYKMINTQGSFSNGRTQCEASDAWPVEIKSENDYRAATFVKGKLKLCYVLMSLLVLYFES